MQASVRLIDCGFEGCREGPARRCLRGVLCSASEIGRERPNARRYRGRRGATSVAQPPQLGYRTCSRRLECTVGQLCASLLTRQVMWMARRCYRAVGREDTRFSRDRGFAGTSIPAGPARVGHRCGWRSCFRWTSGQACRRLLRAIVASSRSTASIGACPKGRSTPDVPRDNAVTRRRR